MSYITKNSSGGAAPTSRIGLDTVTGCGSTNDSCAIFTNVADNNGSTDLTYNSSATAGDSITINTTGLYTFGFHALGAGKIFITKNSTALTQASNPEGMSFPKRLSENYDGSAFGPIWASATYYCTAGDIIRFQSNYTLGSYGTAQFAYAQRLA